MTSHASNPHSDARDYSHAEPLFKLECEHCGVTFRAEYIRRYCTPVCMHHAVKKERLERSKKLLRLRALKRAGRRRRGDAKP